MAAPDPRAEPPPLDARALAALPADVWAVVQRHARASLLALDEATLTPVARRLRATPPAKLVSGRVRDELCALLAQDERLWHDTRSSLIAAAGWDAVETALAAPPAATPEEGSRTARSSPARPDATKEQLRIAREERDEARRKLRGADARARAAARDAERLARELDRAIAEAADLRARLARRDDEHREVIQRLQRQHHAQLEEQRDELRELRRTNHEREERGRREQQRRAAAEAAAREELVSFRARPERAGGATPGRPSRLPAGVAPGSPDAAAVLLDRGRRVIVDGYNVSKQRLEDRAPQKKKKKKVGIEQQREWLVALLDGLAVRRGVVPHVVFDGPEDVQAPRRGSKLVTVSFSGGVTADDRIVTLVSKLPRDEAVVVVTDDRELRARLAEHRVDLLDTTSLLSAAQ